MSDVFVVHVLVCKITCACCVGLRGIIMGENTDKAMCTRALWCLANQSIVSSQLISHVTSLVTVVSKVMLSQRCATPTVESEGLNFYTRWENNFVKIYINRNCD